MYLSEILVEGYRAACRGPLTCQLPGRFAVLAGANSSGKTTIIESILLAHPDVFPYLPRPRANRLSNTGDPRQIEISYAYESPERSALGKTLSSQEPAPIWSADLSTSMGRVSVSRTGAPTDHLFPVLHLSPTRAPNNDLGGREAQLVVELLRAEARRTRGDKSLNELRSRISGMMTSLVDQWPIASAEERVRTHLDHLTIGVEPRSPFLAPSTIDDAVIARVFEFLLSGTSREEAIRLEDDGLGYANLLQLAVIFAAIPDGTAADDLDEISEHAEAAEDIEDTRTDDQRLDEMRQAEERSELEDDTFFPNDFHALVLVEEPEAHLHPQLQHSLVTYIKSVVAERPELQVLMTTHSDRIVSACDPDDLVILHTDSDGRSRSTPIKSLGLTRPQRTQLRRHLDTTRSASIFTGFPILVEGPTDAMMVRLFGRVWATGDLAKQRFVEAATITELGSKVGEWLPRTLANPGNQIALRCAVLKDTDNNKAPAWTERLAGGNLQVFWSDPTLEPSLVEGNESLLSIAFDLLGEAKPIWQGPEPTKAEVAEWIADSGRSQKASFAESVLDAAQNNPELVSVPDHIERLWDYLWEGHPNADRSAEPTSDDSTSSE